MCRLLNEVVVTAPTIGSNVEELVYKNIRFVMWGMKHFCRLFFFKPLCWSDYRHVSIDIGGQDSARSSWDTYYIHTRAVIMVIDSTDRERMNLNKQELVKMLGNETLAGSAVLVFANKQDLKVKLLEWFIFGSLLILKYESSDTRTPQGAMSAAEITEALNLHAIRDHIWHIQACCALTGEGYVLLCFFFLSLSLSLSHFQSSSPLWANLSYLFSNRLEQGLEWISQNVKRKQ